MRFSIWADFPAAVIGQLKTIRNYMPELPDLLEVDVANSLRWDLESKPKADEEGARLEAAENSSCYVSCLLLKFLLPVSRYCCRFSVAR
jgi:hypothetical protein